MEELLHCEEDDDFEAEVESLHNNPEFVAFLAQLSQEETVVSLEALRRELLEPALLSEATLAEDWLRPEEDEAWAYLSSQQQFAQLPFEKKLLLLEKQAIEMIDYYQQTSNERDEWQSGDFIEPD